MFATTISSSLRSKTSSTTFGLWIVFLHPLLPTSVSLISLFVCDACGDTKGSLSFVLVDLTYLQQRLLKKIYLPNIRLSHLEKPQQAEMPFQVVSASTANSQLQRRRLCCHYSVAFESFGQYVAYIHNR